MRISDWSSDVCSSDLQLAAAVATCLIIARRVRAGRQRRANPRRSAHFLAVQIGRRVIFDRCRAARCGKNFVIAESRPRAITVDRDPIRSEEHTSELQSLMRNSYAAICLKKKNT